MIHGHDRDVFLLLVLLFAFIAMRRGAFGGGGWERRMEQVREKVERDREEQRAFRDLVLVELRRQNAAAEQQNVLLAQIATRLSSTGPEPIAPVAEINTATPPQAEPSEPRPRRNRKTGSEAAD